MLALTVIISWYWCFDLTKDLTLPSDSEHVVTTSHKWGLFIHSILKCYFWEKIHCRHFFGGGGCQGKSPLVQIFIIISCFGLNWLNIKLGNSQDSYRSRIRFQSLWVTLYIWWHLDHMFHTQSIPFTVNYTHIADEAIHHLFLPQQQKHHQHMFVARLGHSLKGPWRAYVYVKYEYLECGRVWFQWKGLTFKCQPEGSLLPPQGRDLVSHTKLEFLSIFW